MDEETLLTNNESEPLAAWQEDLQPGVQAESPSQTEVLDPAAVPAADQPTEGRVMRPAEVLTQPLLDQGSKPDVQASAGKESSFTRKSKARPEGKPTAEEFLENAQKIVKEAPRKSALASLLKLLKAGYQPPHNADHLEQLENLVAGWGQESKLALQLTVLSAAAQKTTPVLRGLRDRLQRRAFQAVSYPRLVEAEPKPDANARLKELLQWVRQGGKTEEVNPSKLDPNWARLAVVCLMEEPAPIREHALYTLLETCVELSGKREIELILEDEAAQFMTEVGTVLGADTLTPAKLRSGLRYAAPARLRTRKVHRDLLNQKTLTTEAAEKAQGLAAEVDRLQSELLAAREEAKLLSNAAVAKQRQLEEAESQRDNLEHHFEQQLHLKLERQANQIKADLGHEIQEAQLALDSPSPSTRMALERLRRMDQALSKLVKDE